MKQIVTPLSFFLHCEIRANNWCYNSRLPFSSPNFQLESKPLYWLVIPRIGKNDFRFFYAKNFSAQTQLKTSFHTTIDTDNIDIVAIPIHWKEAEYLFLHIGENFIKPDGEIFRTSSPRTLVFYPERKPDIFGDNESYIIKTSLSDESYSEDALSGLTGKRTIDDLKCKIAIANSALLESLFFRLSPYLEIQKEVFSISGKIHTDNFQYETGAIFREHIPYYHVPAFSLYSETDLQFPYVDYQTIKDIHFDEKQTHNNNEQILKSYYHDFKKFRLLGIDAIEFALSKNDFLQNDKILGFIKLYIEPVYDVIFSLFAQGMAHELHPQNFFFAFDLNSGLTKKIIIKDLHGLNYSFRYRKKNGLKELFHQEFLKETLPFLQQEDLAQWQKSYAVNTINSRFTEPKLFDDCLNTFISIFYYHLLCSFFEYRYFTKEDIDIIIIKIKEMIIQKSEQWGFSLKRHLPLSVSDTKKNFWLVYDNGLKNSILFFP